MCVCDEYCVKYVCVVSVSVQCEGVCDECILCVRIERIDFLDERELLEQLLRHYCLSSAYLGSSRLGELNMCQSFQ